MTTVPSFIDLLKGARLPEASLAVCLRADLAADYEATEREIEALAESQKAAGSLAGSPTSVLTRRLEELRQEMRAATYTFRLRALSKSAWRALVAEHPPRKGDDGEPLPEDARVGIHMEPFLAALIRVSVIDPVMPEEQWAEFVEKITDRQYSDLCDAAWLLNRGEISVPFSPAASRQKPGTDNG